MTDQELARALFEAGLLTQEQVQTAAAQRTPTQNFAQVVVNLGWVSPAQIAQFAPNALGAQTPPPVPTAPAPTAPAPTAPAPNYGASGYGAPATTPGYGAPASRPAEVRIGAVGDAWKLISAQLGTWIGTTVLFLIASGIVQVPVYIATIGAMQNVDFSQPGASPEINPLIRIFSGIGSLCVSAFLMPGAYKMALKQIDGQPISIGDLFSGGAYFGQSILALFLYYIAMVLGVFACCIGTFVALAGLSFALPLIVDRNMNAVDALKLSWNTLKGQILPMILFLIVTGLCVLVGYLACGIGIIVSYAFAFVAPMIVYRDFFPASGNQVQDQSNYPPPPIPSPF